MQHYRSWVKWNCAVAQLLLAAPFSAASEIDTGLSKTFRQQIINFGLAVSFVVIISSTNFFLLINHQQFFKFVNVLLSFFSVIIKRLKIFISVFFCYFRFISSATFFFHLFFNVKFFIFFNIYCSITVV